MRWLSQQLGDVADKANGQVIMPYACGHVQGKVKRRCRVIIPPSPTVVACADIHTGISAVHTSGETLTFRECTACFEFLGQVFCSTDEMCVNETERANADLRRRIALIKEALHGQVVRQMPISQIVFQINTLNLYRSHAQALDVNSLRGLARLDPGYPEFRVMVDVNGDGRADYCRFVGNPGMEFLSCALATSDGRFGNYDVTLDTGSKEEIEQRWGNRQLPQN
jgi:hypothetical protein